MVELFFKGTVALLVKITLYIKFAILINNTLHYKETIEIAVSINCPDPQNV